MAGDWEYKVVVWAKSIPGERNPSLAARSFSQWLNDRDADGWEPVRIDRMESQMAAGSVWSFQREVVLRRPRR